MQIIGLVGEKGSGKDTFAHYLSDQVKEKRIIHIRFSDLLKQTLNLWDLPISRSNLQKMAQLLEEGFGSGTVAHGIEIQIQKTQADIIVLDGIRWRPDVELLNKFPKHTLIYITAESKTRFERLKSRGEKDGESKMDYDQFLEEEKAPNELLISEIGSDANFKITNNGSIADFEVEVKKIVDATQL